ncbi:MAG: integrin alpha [Gammaproteobacteria bacterium]
MLELSALNGGNGFQINGESASGTLGRAVSGLGDVNGDGLADLIIGDDLLGPNGPNSGASYVVFGRAHLGATGILEVSALNGADGFRINGEAARDYAGRALSGLGDVNGDGIADLLIGAYGADPNGNASGASYVVFGRTNLGADGVLELSALNGANGFQINGEATVPPGPTGDHSGFAVSGLGDVNGDGRADLLIGAYYADPNGHDSGASYVIFGTGRTADQIFKNDFE